MKKTEIIKYLDERIAALSGGDEMKSLGESCADEQIVKELKAVKDFIDNGKFTPESKRYVGVISENVKDFLDWRRKQGFLQFKHLESMRIFEADNTLYTCLSSPEHACSWSFDEITQTPNARQNINYEKIVKSCMHALCRDGKWNLQ